MGYSGLRKMRFLGLKKIAIFNDQKGFLFYLTHYETLFQVFF